MKQSYLGLETHNFHLPRCDTEEHLKNKKNWQNYLPTEGKTRCHMLQVGRSMVRHPMRLLAFPLGEILPAAIWPWSPLRLQQKYVPGIFLFVKGDQCIKLIISSPSVGWLHSKYRDLDVSQAYLVPRPVTRMDLRKHKYSMCYTFTPKLNISVTVKMRIIYHNFKKVR